MAGLKWNGVHTKFCQNRLSNSKVEGGNTYKNHEGNATPFNSFHKYKRWQSKIRKHVRARVTLSHKILVRLI
jgi:hypothetical protein